MIPGLHLHDHSGKAYFNYRNLGAAGFDATDVSLGGIGKGLGNLKLEHVFNLRGREHILDHLILDKELFRMPSGPYGVLTARKLLQITMRSKPNGTGQNRATSQKIRKN